MSPRVKVRESNLGIPKIGQSLHQFKWHHKQKLTLQGTAIHFGRIEVQLAPRGALEHSVRTEEGAIRP
jgi:hypothetical protein